MLFVVKNERVVQSYPALARPAFARYLVGQVLSGFGTWFQIVAQSLLLIDLTQSGRALGVASALQFVPVLILSPYAGVVLDRVEARRVLLITSVAAAVLAVGLGALVAFGHITVHGVWVFALGLGLVQTFDRPAQGAMLAELVPLEHRPNATALANIQTASGRLVGPAVGGLLYAAFGAAPCFFLNALSFGIIIFALVRIPVAERLARPLTRSRTALADLRAGVSYVRATPALRTPLLCATAVGLLAFNFLVVMPAMVSFVFHAGGRAFGICEALNAGASVVGGLVLAPRLKKPTQRRLAVALAMFAVGVVGLAAMPTLLWWAAWMPVFGLCFIVYQTSMMSLLQARCDPTYLGRVMSLYSLAVFGTTPFGALMAGWLVDHVSARAAMAMGLVAAIPCAAWLWFSDPTRRSVPTNAASDSAIATC
jgi:MFS family permease